MVETGQREEDSEHIFKDELDGLHLLMILRRENLRLMD
jgi:hypothetical protein